MGLKDKRIWSRVARALDLHLLQRMWDTQCQNLPWLGMVGIPAMKNGDALGVVYCWAWTLSPSTFRHIEQLR